MDWFGCTRRRVASSRPSSATSGSVGWGSFRAKRWNGGTVERWNGGTVERWNGGTVERWNGGTVERWNGGAGSAGHPWPLSSRAKQGISAGQRDPSPGETM